MTERLTAPGQNPRAYPLQTATGLLNSAATIEAQSKEIPRTFGGAMKGLSVSIEEVTLAAAGQTEASKPWHNSKPWMSER